MTATLSSDEVLVKRTLEEGSQHFGALVKRHSDYLFGYGLRLTGGNRALAEDLAQQAFIRAYRYLDSFNQKHHSLSAESRHRFRNWLTGIATNCFNDLVKTEQRYQPLESHLEPSYDPHYAESHQFYDLIKPLNSEDRILFVLRYVYDFKVGEIARLMNLNEGTVKSKISRALHRLKQQYSKREQAHD